MSKKDDLQQAATQGARIIRIDFGLFPILRRTWPQRRSNCIPQSNLLTKIAKPWYYLSCCPAPARFVPFPFVNSLCARDSLGISFPPSHFPSITSRLLIETNPRKDRVTASTSCSYRLFQKQRRVWREKRRQGESAKQIPHPAKDAEFDFMTASAPGTR